MSRSRTDDSGAGRPALSDATVDVLLCTQALVEERLALSAARAATALQHAAIPIAFAIVSAIAGLVAGGFALAAATLGLAVWLPWWASTAIVSGLTGLFSLSLGALAYWLFRTDRTPVIPVEEATLATDSSRAPDASASHPREAA